MQLSKSNRSPVRNAICLRTSRGGIQRIENLSKTDLKNIRVAAFSAFLASRQNRTPRYNFCNNPLSFVHYSNFDSHISDKSTFASGLIEKLRDRTNIRDPANHATHNGLRTPTHLNLFSAPVGRVAELEFMLGKN